MAAQENGSNNGHDAVVGDVLTELRNTMTVGYIHEAYKEWCIKNADYVSRGRSCLLGRRKWPNRPAVTHTERGVLSVTRFCYAFPCELRGPAWAVGSYSISQSAGETSQNIIFKTLRQTSRSVLIWSDTVGHFVQKFILCIFVNP